jgi:UDP-glucose 6-dehydrogenase
MNSGRGISFFGMEKIGTIMISCLAKGGLQIPGVDPSKSVVDAINRRDDNNPEPGVTEKLASSPQGQINSTTDPVRAVIGSTLSLVIVPTPGNSIAGFLNRLVLNACTGIGRAMRRC